MIILTSQEKIELLQEMKMPTRNLFLLEASLNADVYEKNLSYIIDCDISSYFDLTDIKSFTNYTQIDFDVKMPNYDGIGNASVYVDSKICLGLIIKFKDKESYNHTVTELKKYFNTKEIDALTIAVTAGLIR